MTQIELPILENALKIGRIHNSLTIAENYLKELKIITFGIESIAECDRSIDYINLGDTYSVTIIKEGAEYSISSWGDWLEKAESKYCQDNDVIRCAYCGKYTPFDKEDWRDVVCEPCGHLVGG